LNGTTGNGLGEALHGRSVAKGLAAFVVLTGAGLLVLFTFTARGAAGETLPRLHAGFLLLASASAILDTFLGALRYHVFIRKIRRGTSLWLPIRADLANRFVGAVTPSQTGGGPAQVFILHRGGVPVPEALSFLAINFLFTLVVFLTAGGAAAWALGDRVPAGIASPLLRYGGTALLGGLVLMLIALGRPDACARALERAASHLERVAAGWARVCARAGRFLAGSVDRYRTSCARFLREDPTLPLTGLVLTLLLYLNKFTLAWLVLRGLGAEGAYGTTVAVQALLHLILYVAPTPGGSGIAELTTGALMSVVLPGPMLGPFTLAYRVLLVYAPATVGAFVLAAELRRKQKIAARAEPLPEGGVPASSPGRKPGPRVGAGLAGLLLLGLGASVARADADCPLCHQPFPATLVALSEGEVVRAAMDLADGNAARIALIDSRLRRGAFGDPGSREAREQAHSLARVSLPNLYHYLFRFANDPDHIYESGPDALTRLAADFVEPLLFPVARLRRARLGCGLGCVEYDLDEKVAGWTNVGGKVRRFRVTDVKIEGRPRRVLAISYASASVGRAEILVAAHYSFEVVHVREPGPPAPHDLFVVRSLDGVWVRHHGVHRPEAFAYWVSPRDPNPTPVSASPMAGVRIYFPGLRFKLPWVLPDIDLEDLRTLGLPMPLLTTSYLRRQEHPGWLEADPALDFEDWVGIGVLPAGVRDRFPNNPPSALQASSTPSSGSR
jgi:uncharacterized protein (TIRG00374 family)